MTLTDVVFYKGSSGTDIFHTLQQVCGNKHFLELLYFGGLHSLKNEVINKTSPCLTSCATDEDHMTKVREILDTDRR